VGEFSELAPADFSMMCESDYYKRYRTTWSYLSGAAPDDLLHVAQALRVLVEEICIGAFRGSYGKA
jgi:hypothetical protein